MSVNYLVQSSSFYIAFGLSSDTKPTGSTSTVFIETDTGRVYGYASGNWTQSTHSFTSSMAGGVTSSGGGTTNFLRADGSWSAPPGGAPSAHASTHITGGSDTLANFAATSTGLVPLSGTSTGNYLQGNGTWTVPASGSDPWTYLQVSAQHYGTSNTAFADIPGLIFTPGTNSTYEVEWHLMLKTSTAATTPRIGVRWPTGTSSAGWINQGQTNSTQLFTWGNQISTMQVPAAGLFATTTAPWGTIGGALVRALGGAASSFALQHASETAGTFVTTMIGSYLKYRTF